MPDDVCKYCGAKSDPEQQGWKAFYLCKTGIDIDGTVFRGCQCYENQIAALQEKVVKITGQKRRLVNRLRMVNAQAEIFCDMADEADAKNAALQQGIRETVEVVRAVVRYDPVLRAGLNYPPWRCDFCGSLTHKSEHKEVMHRPDCIALKAAALLPTLEQLAGEG